MAKKAKHKRLTDEEKAERKRQRMLNKAKEDEIGTYAGKVARIFQEMIRAEAAAEPNGWTCAVVNGATTPDGVRAVDLDRPVQRVWRNVGQCVCVTCGKRGPWKGNHLGGAMHAGHFLRGRNASILFEEIGVNPQCNHCNYTLGGNEGAYRLWMTHVYGQKEVDRLDKLRHEPQSWDWDDLVDKNIEFRRRLKAAEERMKELIQ